ncbi:SAM-dependent methyltransferase [Allocoprobacillus halotolerans]|uniref:SAM-dependent methyltransferase n=1 Tax=Allocoprobacillus halotolerans TaxID=2944914 RepID=UPI003F492871
MKPQFEAGREDVGKHGIVSQPEIHHRVIQEVIEYAHEQGFSLQGLTYSPITGGEGNIEFLGCFLYQDKKDIEIDIHQVVEEAHSHFKG